MYERERERERERESQRGGVEYLSGGGDLRFENYRSSEREDRRAEEAEHWQGYDKMSYGMEPHALFPSVCFCLRLRLSSLFLSRYYNSV
jgi:hypothetical protein